MKFTVPARFHGIGWNGSRILDIGKETELALVDDQIVVILERLDRKEGEQLLAELVCAATVIAHIQNQRLRSPIVDLPEHVIVIFAEGFVVRARLTSKP